MTDDYFRKINAKLRIIDKKVDAIWQRINDTIVEDRLISVKEAAEILCISEQRLRQEIKDGNISAQRTNRAYKLSKIEVLKRVGYQINKQ